MTLDNSLWASGALSLLVVPLTSFLKRDHWPNVLNFMIALVLSVGGGVATTLTTHGVHTLHQFVSLSAVTLATSTLIFHTYFSGSDFDSYLTKAISGSKKVDPFVKEASALITTLSPSTTHLVNTVTQGVDTAEKAVEAAVVPPEVVAPAVVVTPAPAQ